ncbi:MAG: peptide-methionine (R)-S-oxide reductase MsrB [Okeania sp. SIO2C9]|nr:peptide-methionine (R)-S-oxide reductase MsrB [Okeania sp. SIO2C9]NEQ78635.1 peptide-methionine (R)-S-oxide reductase MsrB [Okeania sp. SIO2C9]
MSEEEIKEKLSPEAYHVCRMGGTEAPFTGELLNNKEPGTYHCVVCGSDLFLGKHKFDSGTGWPSFNDLATSSAVKRLEDRSHGMIRTEVRCGHCDSHLGHVFPDGPPPTGQRYCINSVALRFVPEEP